MSLLWDQCCRCTGWISYEQGEESVVCPQCGERMHVFKLRGEQSRINQELLSGRQAQRALNATQKEAHEAQERLNRAVAALGDIRHSQEKEENILRDLSQQIGADQEAVRNILHEMRDEQSAGQDALRYMIGVVLRGQGSGVEKIETLHFAMEKMMEKQSNAETVLKALEERMQLDAQQRETLMREMDEWNKKEFYITQPRLAMIKADTEKMLASQQQLAVKMEKLQSTVEAATEKLVELHSSGQQSREDRLDAILQRAEELRAMRDFKEAEIEYRKYLEYGAPKYDRDPEIYWRILQSHYGIVYEYSGMTESYVPTLCHPDLNNRCKFDREKMLKFCATDAQRRDYEKRLQEIDDILAEYSALIGREDYCYDVFISVKHGDGKGGKTRDSALAQELWSTLTKWGLKTFNSECSRLPLGKNYEPHIIAALLSAKVMIVVGTSSEHMNAPWVRNEWQRFLWLQEDEGRAGLRERELFCYLSRNMDEKTLPEGLSAQKQLLREGFGAEEKLKDYLRSMFPEKMNRHSAGKSRYRADTASTDAASNASLNQMKIWLGMGKYQLVQEKYNEMVQKGEGMDSVYTYLYALCATYQKATIDQLAESEIDLSTEQLYLYAKKFGSEQEMLQHLLARNQVWHEAEEKKRLAELERQRRIEEKRRQDAENERKRREEEEQKRYEQEERQRREEEKRRRKAEEERKRREEEARQRRAAEERKRREDEERRRIEEEERQRLKKEARKRRRPLILIVLAIAVVAAYYFVSTKGIDGFEIKESLKKIISQQTNKAVTTKSSITPSAPTSTKKPTPTPAPTSRIAEEFQYVKAGQSITFGTYKQNFSSKTDIRWLVLAVEDDRMLVLSYNCLEAVSYHNKAEKPLTWENSNIRKYLNNDFYNSAFSAAEKQRILKVQLENYGTGSVSGGNSTWDRVFLLSIDEVKKYLPSLQSRSAEATKYAQNQGAYLNNGRVWWWLRSPGYKTDGNIARAAGVYGDGTIDEAGTTVNFTRNGTPRNGMRPAMWIDITR